MYLVVGLGNPGKEYEGTRHNIGFEAIDYLSDKYNIELNREKFKGVFGEGFIKGLFIAMPSRKATDGEYRDIAHPINSGTREKIQTIILKQYEQAMAEAEAEEAAAEA